ncbi:MAG: hypothetical protein HY360_26475 [Verrucomicrobia bacterium]|nr:hypothetical protein [Verrucomicrobiota bacterium]
MKLPRDLRRGGVLPLCRRQNNRIIHQNAGGLLDGGDGLGDGVGDGFSCWTTRHVVACCHRFQSDERFPEEAACPFRRSRMAGTRAD